MTEQKTTERMVRMMAETNKMTEGCRTTSEVGRQMGLTPRETFRRLKQRGVIYYDKLLHCYRLGSRYWGCGLVRYRCCIYYSREGEQKMKQYPVWTPRGETVIRQILAEDEE